VRVGKCSSGLWAGESSIGGPGRADKRAGGTVMWAAPSSGL
jgi:hypothetical protein